MQQQIVVIEDNEDIREFVSDFLSEKGFVVRGFGDAIPALSYIEKKAPDLVILDLGLPTVTGESVCKKIKSEYPGIKVIILTAKGSKPDVIKGLNLGADDYLPKPFDIDELYARVKARLREENKTNKKLQIEDLILDNEKVEVTRGGKIIHLTSQEFKLLEYLMSHANKVLSRDMILNRIWLYSTDVNTRVVDVYIGYLRKKIDQDYPNKLIHSVRGFGYMIKS